MEVYQPPVIAAFAAGCYSRTSTDYSRTSTDYGAKGSHFAVVPRTASAWDCCAACRNSSWCSYFVRDVLSGACYLKADQGPDRFTPLAGFTAGGPVLRGPVLAPPMGGWLVFG